MYLEGLVQKIQKTPSRSSLCEALHGVLVGGVDCIVSELLDLETFLYRRK